MTVTAPPVTQNDDSGNEDDDEWDRAARDSYGGRNRSRQRSAASNALTSVQTDVLAPFQAGARAAAAALATNNDNSPSRGTMSPEDSAGTQRSLACGRGGQIPPSGANTTTSGTRGASNAT